MNIIPLSEWISKFHSKHSNLTILENKHAISIVLDCSLSTLYLWINSGDTYIEESIKDGKNALTVWHMKKVLVGYK